MTRMGTLRGVATPAWSRLIGRDNALNFVRLCLALTVLIKHTWNASHNAPGPLPYVAALAVDCFFGISGFLIAGSRMNSDFRGFMWRRACRILPGLWFALILTSAILAPVSAMVTGKQYQWWEGVRYLLANSFLFPSQGTIGDTLNAAPIGSTWNASIWTLPYEFIAYMVLGLLLSIKEFGRKSAACLSGFMAIFTVIAMLPNSPCASYLTFARLFSFFAAGALLWFWRESLPVRLSVPVCAVSIAVIGASLQWSYPFYLTFAPVPVSFVMLWLGAALPLRKGVRNDISYGLYVNAFPVTQFLIVCGVVSALGDFPYTVIVVMLTIPLAWLSWLTVERPALRFGRHVSDSTASQVFGESRDNHLQSSGA